MKRDDWERLGMHAPWGALAGVLYFQVGEPYGIAAVALMIGYEAFNDWRKMDKSYKDVIGIVWGWLIVGVSYGIGGLIWRL
jgi:hypothetical protein